MAKKKPATQPTLTATLKKKATKESVRTRALKALIKKADLNAAEVKAAIGLGHGLKPTLDQEVERGHASAKDVDGTTV